jgi:hypothetical protein
MGIEADARLLEGLEMTRKLLELVKAQEWEAVAELGDKRLRLLQQWGREADPSRAQAHIGILQEIQTLDRQIETLGRQGRDEAAGRLRQLRQGRKAGKAYCG